MKRIMLTVSLAMMLLSVKSQIIITGYLANAKSSTSPTDANNEYIQLKATQDIDFANTNYAVVTNNNATDSEPKGQLANGWATGGDRTYKFDLVSGSVRKGEFFYVGGGSKLINGAGSTSISTANWIVSRDYSKIAGDGFGSPTTNLHANSGNVAGIAVFSGTTVNSTTVPIDVIFYGKPGAGGSVYQANPELGLRICTNDLYSLSAGEYFRKGANTATILADEPTDALFSKLGGEYDMSTNTWKTARSLTKILLNDASTLADIETGTGITTLPVVLSSFTAKTTGQGAVSLQWTTTSEQNSNLFEITRSNDGIVFHKIGEMKAGGNTNEVKQYNFNDAKPGLGMNYYRLKQIDNDGKYTFSSIAAARVGLNKDNLTVSIDSNRSAISVIYHSLTEGKALFTVYNTSGLKITSATQQVNAGANQIKMPINLPTGIHVLKVSHSGASISAKF